MDLNYFVALISIIFLLLINSQWKAYRITLFFNYIIFSESIILTFYFEKFPSLLSIPLFLLSFYFILKESSKYFFREDRIGTSLFGFFHPLIFPISSFFLFISIFIYEYFGDGSFSTNSLLVLILSLLFFTYNKGQEQYSKELDFLLVFFSIQVLLFVILPVLYKIHTNNIGQTITGKGWIDDIDLVNSFLAVPLSNFLNLLGFETVASGQDLFYQDIKSGTFQKVGIAESCSGVYSITLFLSALIAYSLVEHRVINSYHIIMMFFGVLIAYFANILRMSVIVISGHYFGVEMLLFTHKYAGWLIFTFWLFLFWLAFDYFYNYYKMFTEDYK